MDEESKKILIEIITNSKIASLGTCTEDQPYVSMVSFSSNMDFSEFYILISGLAKHTKNILLNNKVSFMISQPETASNNPQTLARISLMGKANLIERNSEDYDSAQKNYLMKNPSAEMYFGLGDFQLYKLEVEKARFVAGFAKTFNLSKESLQNLKNI